MFWDRKEAKEAKMAAPHPLPPLVQKHLVAQGKMGPELAQLLKATVRAKANGQTGLGIRVFDESEALAKKVVVKDFSSFDARPDLIIYEGWFDEASKTVNLEERKKFDADTTVFTEQEIQKKIEALTEPGSTVFFFMARGGKHGGPLAMGCSVIELNPGYPGKKQKKYIIYAADVVDNLPVGKGDKIFDSDKAKDVARWVKEAHHKRMY